MKRLALALVVVTIGLSFSGCNTDVEQPTGPSISITREAPVGGERWQSGTTQKIKWTSSSSASVNIYIAPQEISNSLLMGGGPSNGSAEYLVGTSAFYKTELSLGPGLCK